MRALGKKKTNCVFTFVHLSFPVNVYLFTPVSYLTEISFQLSKLHYFTSIFLKEWKYGDGKKNRVRDYCRF